MSRSVLLVALVAVSAQARPDKLFHWPSSNTTVTVCAYIDHAGKDWKCGTNRYSGHKGVDIALGAGNTVLAAAAGPVIKRTDGCPYGALGSTCGSGAGNHVILLHGADTSLYMHMTSGSNIAAMGANIACGDRLGASGSSGNSSGPHLHFETRLGTTAANPFGGTFDDPYAGACSGPLSYWANQGTGHVPSCGAAITGGAHPQSATTCGCPAGTFNLFNCNEAKTARVRCVAGKVETEACPNGCTVQALGVPDTCNPAPACPSGLGAAWTCSATGERQRCVDGKVTKEPCAFGCEAPASGDAACKAAPACAGGVTEAWSCTTDGLERQRCVAGATQKETCPFGCETQATGGACKTEGSMETPAGCPAGTHAAWTCELDGKTLARCVNGQVQTAQCAGSCVRGASEDQCSDGAGPASVVETKGGCSAAPVMGVAWLALLGLVRRRRP